MLQDMKFLGVYCGTNDAKVVGLTSKTAADGRKTYECICEMTVSPCDCYIHYWECQNNKRCL